MSAVLTGSSLLLALSLVSGVAHAQEAGGTTPVVALADAPQTPQIRILGDDNNNVFIGPAPNDPGGVGVGGQYTVDEHYIFNGLHQIGGDDYSYGFHFHSPDINFGVTGQKGTGPGVGLQVDIGNHLDLDFGFGNGANNVFNNKLVNDYVFVFGLHGTFG